MPRPDKDGGGYGRLADAAAGTGRPGWRHDRYHQHTGQRAGGPPCRGGPAPPDHHHRPGDPGGRPAQEVRPRDGGGGCVLHCLLWPDHRVPRPQRRGEDHHTADGPGADPRRRRHRRGLAAALLGDPEVLVLDEPANGLDPQGIRWLRDLLRSLAAEGRAVLVSSHILAEVAQTVDDVVVISRGRTITQAPLDELLAARPGSTLEDIYLELTGSADGEPS